MTRFRRTLLSLAICKTQTQLNPHDRAEVKIMKKRTPIYVCLLLVAGLGLISRGGLGAAGTSHPTRAAQIALPDLIVDQASLRQHWVVRVEDLPASFCSVQEGNITPGEHTLLRFTVSTPNIGDAELRLGDP